MAKIKQIEGLSEKLNKIKFDTTVGDSTISGLDGQFSTLYDAISAGNKKILFIGSTLETSNITLTSNDYIIDGNSYSINLQMYQLDFSTANIDFLNTTIISSITNGSYIFANGNKVSFNNCSISLTGDLKIIDTSVLNKDILFDNCILDLDNSADTLGNSSISNIRIKNSVVSGNGSNCSINLRSIEDSELSGAFSSSDGIYIIKQTTANLDYYNHAKNVNGSATGTIKTSDTKFSNINLPNITIDVENNSSFTNCIFLDFIGGANYNFTADNCTLGSYSIGSGSGLGILNNIIINNNTQLLSKTFAINLFVNGNLDIFSDFNKIANSKIDGLISIYGNDNDLVNIETLFDIESPTTGSNNSFDYINITTGEQTKVKLISGELITKTIDLDDHRLGIGNPSYKEGRGFYDHSKNTYAYYNDEPEVTVNIGQELLIPVYNLTGQTIPNGALVYPTGEYNGRHTIGLALASKKDRSRFIAMATHDIPNGGKGYVTRLGTVGGINTDGLVGGLYLSDTIPGGFTAIPPTGGSYQIQIGGVKESAVNGSITVDPYVSELTVEMTGTSGWPDSQLENTTLSIDTGTRTFSITAIIGTEFYYYEGGYKYEMDSPQSVVFSNVEGTKWFYFVNGILQSIDNPSEAEIKDIYLNNTAVMSTYWDSVNQIFIPCMGDRRHGISMSAASRYYEHKTKGPQYISGLSIGDIIPDATGDLDTHAQFSITSGHFVSEDIDHTSPIFNVGDTINVFYFLGNTPYLRRSSTSGFAVLIDGGGNLLYNDYNGGNWQLTAVGNNNYTLYHILSYGGITNQIISVAGQSMYNSISDARTGATTEINTIISQYPEAEIIALGTIIFQANLSYANAVNARIRSTETGDPYIDWRTTELKQGVVPTNHDLLTNLQLADTGVTWGHINDLAQDIYGIKTFHSLIVGPSIAPTTNYQMANKKYVDDNLALTKVGTGETYATIYAAITAGKYNLFVTSDITEPGSNVNYNIKGLTIEGEAKSDGTYYNITWGSNYINGNDNLLIYLSFTNIIFTHSNLLNAFLKGNGTNVRSIKFNNFETVQTNSTGNLDSLGTSYYIVRGIINDWKYNYSNDSYNRLNIQTSIINNLWLVGAGTSTRVGTISTSSLDNFKGTGTFSTSATSGLTLSSTVVNNLDVSSMTNVLIFLQSNTTVRNCNGSLTIYAEGTVDNVKVENFSGNTTVTIGGTVTNWEFNKVNILSFGVSGTTVRTISKFKFNSCAFQAIPTTTYTVFSNCESNLSTFTGATLTARMKYSNCTFSTLTSIANNTQSGDTYSKFLDCIFSLGFTVTTNRSMFERCQLASTLGLSSDYNKLIANEITGLVTLNSGADHNVITENTLTASYTDNSGVTTNIIINNI